MWFGGEAFIKRASSEISILRSIFVVLCTVYLMASYAFIYLCIYLYLFGFRPTLCTAVLFESLVFYVYVTFYLLKKLLVVNI